MNRLQQAFLLLISKTRLTIILRFYTGLVGEFTKKQSAILERLESRLDELLVLINDLLTLARSKNLTEDTPLEKIPLQPVIQKSLQQFEAMAAEKGFGLHLDEPGLETNVHASEDGLTIIFTNLISNAIKYSRDGGKVRIKVEPKDQIVRVEVKDEGIGIPQDALQKIGQEFFRAPNAQGSSITGTGLGLSIVQQYLDHFGGDFSIDSKERWHYDNCQTSRVVSARGGYYDAFGGRLVPYQFLHSLHSPDRHIENKFYSLLCDKV